MATRAPRRAAATAAAVPGWPAPITMTSNVASNSRAELITTSYRIALSGRRQDSDFLAGTENSGADESEGASGRPRGDRSRPSHPHSKHQLVRNHGRRTFQAGLETRIVC